MHRIFRCNRRRNNKKTSKIYCKDVLIWSPVYMASRVVPKNRFFCSTIVCSTYTRSRLLLSKKIWFLGGDKGQYTGQGASLVLVKWWSGNELLVYVDIIYDENIIRQIYYDILVHWTEDRWLTDNVLRFICHVIKMDKHPAKSNKSNNRNINLHCIFLWQKY